MNWKDKAIKILKDSLYPIPTELNELDWKSDISSKTDRLIHHLSAMANQKGGGILVFGVHDDGRCFTPTQDSVKKTIQTIGNIALNGLNTPIAIEHAVMDFEGNALLFIYIQEVAEKPVYLRGKTIFDSYHRSAGTTIKMSRGQVRSLIAESQGISFEDRIAKPDLSAEQILELLNYKSLYQLIDKNVPSSTDTILEKFKEFSFCKEEDSIWSITNLGAILFAKDLAQFPSIFGHEVIVRKYSGTSNLQQEFERHIKSGYAMAFQGLVDFIVQNTGKEIIDVKRELIPTYPRVAIREFVANALVHQDFAITGMPITIEIFSNRLVITNPGAPLNDINRLIDLPPHSRNEKLAQTMFLLNICERRGSGIDRAVDAVEKMYLPAVKFTKSEQHTKVFLFPAKALRDMSKHEKVQACYQHACLKYENSETINNQSIRERFELNKNKSAVASRIISDTQEAGLIKLSDADITSKKYATYIPYYG